MSKKCAICGTELDETAAVCPKCGTRNFAETVAPQSIPAEPAETVVADVPEVPVTPPAPRKKIRKSLPWILGGAAAVILAVVMILTSAWGNTPEPAPDTIPTDPPIVPTSVLYKYLALMNGNVDQLESIAPKQYWEYRAQAEKMTVAEVLAQDKDILATVLKQKRQEYGNYQATAEILSESPLSEQTMAKIIQELSRYGIAESSVSAARSMRIKGSLITENNTAAELNSQLLHAIQIDGIWYLTTCYQFGDDFIVSFFEW